MKRPFPSLAFPFRSMFVFFLVIDLGFIGLNVAASALGKLHLVGPLPAFLMVTEDLGIPEFFNYFKWALIAVALAWIAVRDRWFAPLAWALIFTMILVDDSMQVHEHLGVVISRVAKLPENMLFHGNDLGEVVAFVMMGTIAALLVLTSLFDKDPASRRLATRYVLVIAGLSAFGVAVDALHQVLWYMAEAHLAPGTPSTLLGLIEDGGEMIVASVALALTLAPPEDTRGANTLSDARAPQHRSSLPD